jgi:LCP family protein required for cell wall assembly
VSLSQIEAVPEAPEPDLPELESRSDARARARRARRRRRITIGVLTGMVCVLTATAGVLYFTVRTLPSSVHRINGAFNGIKEEERPTKAATAKGSLTFLLAGSDSREPTTGTDSGEPALQPGGQRSDVMMLINLAADRKSATFVSIPRDSWVTIPGRGKAKLNAAYSWGGPPLLIRTIEALTGIRVDHYAAIDFFGFQGIVNAVDGVDVPMADDATLDGRSFPAGINHLNGKQALSYVRERHSLPRGDLDRVQRQQNLIRSVAARASTLNPMRDPIKTYNLVDAGLKSISVDDSLTNEKLRDLALSLIGLGSSDLSFLTAPVTGLGREGDQSVVYLDDTRCVPLWTAFREDTVGDYVTTHKNDLLTTIPR